MRPLRVLTLLAATLACGCASRAPARVVVAEAPPPPVAIDTGATSVESEIGGMSDEDVGRAADELRRDLGACFHAERSASLGGHLKLNLRVDRRGAVKWAYLGETTLGDRDAEKCILDRARAKTWPLPRGGDGLVETSFDVDASGPVLALDAKRVKSTVTHALRATQTCRRGIAGGFVATVYVRPDGRVLSAGVAPPDAHGESAADCVVEAVRKLRFHAPPKMAKVSFQIR